MVKLFMYVGLSGSGKSSYKIDEEVVVVSSDALRAELYGDENDQTHNTEVFDELHKRVKSALLRGKNVVFDATNLSSRRRKHFLNSISKVGCEKICVVFATPFDICVQRDKARERTVGREVIFNQMKSFNMPHFDEGWDKIEIIQTKPKDVFIDYLQAIELEHDNPHHKETIGEHMIRAMFMSVANNDAGYVAFASGIHDMGKIFTKNFLNAKGEASEIAHFYGHEKVSAYWYICSNLFQGKEEDFKTVWLIENHMRPWFAGYEKWKEKQNPELIKDLEKIHKYDKKSRLV